jgi:RNA polymerase sigma factor (sigma-70 family)
MRRPATVGHGRSGRDHMSSDSTTQLQILVDRMNAGEAGAREELIARACERLRRLTRKIFQDYRRVRRFEDTGDVLQNAVLRLMRRLKNVGVASVAEFFYLAAREIRLELIDLVRHYYGPAGQGTKERDLEQPSANGGDGAGRERADVFEEAGSLAFWTEFHKRAQSLPVLERCIFDLVWYHGMTREEAAAVLNVSLATVKRHWVAARLLLQEFVDKKSPS